MARRLELDDLSRFIMLSNPQLSPDSSKLAHVVTRIEGDTYYTTIWVVDSANGYPIRFYSGGNPLTPRWSPNGQQILFTSRRDMEEDQKGVGIWTTQVWGGEPRLLAIADGGVVNPQWNMYGTKVYFLSDVGEENPDVKYIDKIPLWSDGRGFTYYKTRQLHVVDVASGIISQLTDYEEGINVFSTSNQGDKIAYAKPIETLKPNEHDLYILDITKAKHERILSGYNIQHICWSLEDKEIAFQGRDLRSNDTHAYVYIYKMEDGELVNLTESLDRGSERKHYYNLRSPHAGRPHPVWEGRELYFTVSDGASNHIYRACVDHGNIDPIISGEFSVEEFDVRKDVIAYSRVSMCKPVEMWMKDYEKEGCISRFNNHLTAKVNLSESERFQFQQRDETEVEGWIIKPFGFRKDRKYPAVVDIHGGPNSKFGNSVMFDHQFLAANGYGVVTINIRGSDGYGNKFRDIRGVYGTWDFEDLKKGVEKALAENTWIDPEKLGVTGLSYGGYMTNWAVTHCDMFKAAVSQNGISNWIAFFGTSDIGFHFASEQIGGAPWSNLDSYLEKSPIKYANDVTTPVLFVHSMNDYRCWIDQSIQFYTSLKYQGKPTKLALFNEGPHSFRSLAKPSIRKERLRIMLEWFNEYLK